MWKQGVAGVLKVEVTLGRCPQKTEPLRAKMVPQEAEIGVRGL
jgi:hypothetical protein